jgi:hypothetical protein
MYAQSLVLFATIAIITTALWIYSTNIINRLWLYSKNTYPVEKLNYELGMPLTIRSVGYLLVIGLSIIGFLLSLDIGGI